MPCVINYIADLANGVDSLSSKMNRSGLSFLESVINILKDAGVFEPEKKNVPVVEFEHPLALKVSTFFNIVIICPIHVVYNTSCITLIVFQKCL